MDRKQVLLDHLQPGDVVNFDSKPKWYEFWLKVVYWFIRKYQKKKWGKNSRYRDIHSMLYLGNGRLFSFEAPCAIFRTLLLSKVIYNLLEEKTKKYVKQFDIEDTTRYTICRLRRSDYSYIEFDDQDIDYMRQAANSLIGKKYDYGQLLDILLKQVFKDYIPNKLSILDLGRMRKVCSVGVHWILVKWWKQFKREELDRPLGEQYIEITCPADFVNHSDFGIVVEI